MKSLLLVEDRRGMRAMLTTALREDGWDVTAASDGLEAIALAPQARFDLVLTDICLPGADGLEVLAAFTRARPGVPVILMTAFGTIDLAVKAMKLGARDFITKPFELARLTALLEDCLPGASKEMIGGDRVFLEALDRAEKASRSNLSVLILGESGTGKELLARRIHDMSDRSAGPFIPVNCAAIPSELLESELFGAEKGAFTGADSARPGRFELADGGTIFLDEIGDLAPGLQGKLLRVLQERTFTRIGGAEQKTVDVRILSASNRDLASEASEGRFRPDLFFRLNEFPVSIPPLRERRGDILRLAGHFLAEAGRAGEPLPPDGAACLEAYSWPGNVRELRSIIHRACALASGRPIERRDLEIPEIRESAPSGLLDASVKAAREAERAILEETLEACGWNRSEAARRLGVSRRTLLNKIRDLGLVEPES